MFRPTEFAGERPPVSLGLWLAPPYGAPVPVVVPPRPRRRLPETAVDYPQLLRGPTRAWWRPPLSLGLFALLAIVLMGSTIPVVLAYGLLTGVDDLGLWLDQQLADDGLAEPGGYLLLNLSLVILIPAAMLSVWAVHRIRPRYLSSVAGGLRWRWLLRCLIVLAPLWAVYLTLSTLTDPPQSPRPEQWVALLIIGLLLTPWQAAAEEYAFRGWLTQNIGAYFARPVLAFAVPAVVCAAAFAAVHGSPDPWILADLAVFSLAASVMTWRTGGLEAAIVMHAVNNVGIGLIVTTIGGFDEAFVGTETVGTPLTFAVSLALQTVAVALVLWQAKRTGVERLFCPAGLAGSVVSAAASSAAAEATDQPDRPVLAALDQGARPGDGRRLDPQVDDPPR